MTLTFPTRIEQEARDLWCSALRARKRMQAGMLTEADRAMHGVRVISQLSEFPTVARCAETTLQSLAEMRRTVG